MKNSVLTIIFAASGLLLSCRKDARTGSTQQVTINATVAAGDTYTLPLSTYGSKAAITKQASTYTTSGIDQAGLVYRYSYAAKSAVTDQVVLAVTRDGRCHNTDSTIVTVNLKVQ